MSSIRRIRNLYGRLLFSSGIVAGCVAFVMMALVVANTLLRFFLNAPIAGTLEITESLLTMLIFLSVGLTQFEGGHIHVVLVTERLPQALQRVMRVLAMLLGAVFFAWSTYAAWGFAMKSLAIDEHEWGAISFPVYPVKFIVFLGLLLLTVQFFLDALVALSGPLPRDDDAAHGAGTI